MSVPEKEPTETYRQRSLLKNAVSPEEASNRWQAQLDLQRLAGNQAGLIGGRSAWSRDELSYDHSLALRNLQRSPDRVASDQPSLKVHWKNGKIQVYSYTQKGKTTWIDPFKIAFLGGLGWEVFLWGISKKFSSFGSAFVVAHASLESNFGVGNYGDEYKNLFSVMGGKPGNRGTAHGRLQKYASYEDGLAAYVALLGSKWPVTVEPGTGLYNLSAFSPDDVNKAFRQFNYYNKGGQVYLGDAKADYGSMIFRRMLFIGGPLVALVEEKANGIAECLAVGHDAKEQHLDSSDAEGREEAAALLSQTEKAFRGYAADLRGVSATASTRLAEHEALVKAGQRKP